ncbi:MAG TPA: hypothetical protein V6D17_06300 [Candidatus Obscuribacterales bacterium]
MEIVKERRAGPRRIGELLVAANVIRPEVLLEALQVAKKSSTPLGRVLMSIGELSERDLQMAIEVQSLLREGVIATDFGVRALNAAIKGKVSLEEAFKRLGWQPPQRETVPSTELGELLLAAGIVTPERFEEAVRQSQENNLPVGRCLVLARAISSSLLASALTAQVLLRDGKVSKEQAVNGLRACFRKQQSIEDALQEVGAYKSVKETIRVGDLLTSAGIVTEGDKITAVELGLETNQMVGQVLVQSGMISNATLEESLKLQELVLQGDLDGPQAAEILRTAHNKGVTIKDVLKEKLARKEEIDRANSVIDLLQKANILGPEEMMKIQQLTQQLNVSAGEVVLSTSMISKKIIESAVQSKELIRDEILQEEQVAKVLLICHRTGVEFHEALKKVAWDTTTEDSDNSKAQQKTSWLLKLWSKVKTD